MPVQVDAEQKMRSAPLQDAQQHQSLLRQAQAAIAIGGATAEEQSKGNDMGGTARTTGYAASWPLPPLPPQEEASDSPFRTSVSSPLDCFLFKGLLAVIGISPYSFGGGVCCLKKKLKQLLPDEQHVDQRELEPSKTSDLHANPFKAAALHMVAYVLKYAKFALSYLYPLFCLLVISSRALLVMVFNDRTYGVVNNIADSCVYIWPIFAYLACMYNQVRHDGHRKALQCLRLHLASERAEMIAQNEPPEAHEAHLKRSSRRLLQGHSVELGFFITCIFMIVVLWVVSNLSILIQLPHALEDGQTGAWWDSKPQDIDKYFIDRIGQWYSVYLLGSSLLGFVAVFGGVSSAITGTSSDLQVVSWLVEMALELRASKRSAAWRPWLEKQAAVIRKAHQRRLGFSKVLGYAAIALVGTFTAIYMVLLLATLGKYPKLNAFVFPAMHALAFSLLAAIESKFDTQMYRVEVLLNAKARRTSLWVLERRNDSVDNGQLPDKFSLNLTGRIPPGLRKSISALVKSDSDHFQLEMTNRTLPNEIKSVAFAERSSTSSAPAIDRTTSASYTTAVPQPVRQPPVLWTTVARNM